MINNACIKWCGCVVTFLDLKNAFDEVNHNLRVEALKIHHVPDIIITLIITCLYTDYTILIITDTFMRSPTKVQRGALQGDTLSPLCLIQ